MTQRLLKRMLTGIFIVFSFCYARAQDKVVTGTILDDKGNALSGATIKVKGFEKGVNSDASGKFSLTVPASSKVLVISYIGYTTQEISVAGKTDIQVNLQQTSSNLNEVVVVGYGTQTRKDLTGAIASVKGAQIKNLPVTNATEALQGRAAGVEIIKNSGAPDATPTIIIRGVSSLHQPAPLYIVDGVRVPADNINVQDIATIDVLKDASASAIYGSAAAGGVILITTKKGAGSKPTIDFNMRYGRTRAELVRNLLNRDQYIKLENIVNPQYFTGAAQTDTLPNTNWVDALYRNGYEQNYNLSVAGSSPAVNYLFSGFYNTQEGVYLNNFSNIGGARINTDYKLGNWIKVGEQLAVSQRHTTPPVPGRYDLQYHNAPFRTLPIIPIKNKDGSWGSVPPGYNGLSFSGPNLVGAVENASTDNYKNNFQGNVYAEIKLPIHLTFRTNLGYTYYLETQDYFQNSFNYGAVVQTYNSLNKYFIESTQLLSNYLLTYNQTFDKHTITALAGFEQITGKYNTVNAYESSVGLNGYSFIQTSASGITISGKNDPNALIKSYFGRLNYDYDKRYYLTGSIRQDANFTVFGPNHQKAVFAAGSVGWNISDEAFFKSALPYVNLLKLRGSYGTLGNSAINPYTYASTYTQFSTQGGAASGGQNFSPGGSLVIANSVNSLPNPNLHWETVKETNIGLDGEALNGKLYFTVEWYNKTTSNMLYALPLALSSGITQSYFTNIGNVDSRGWDILAGYRSQAGKLGYDVSVTMGFNHNKVTNLDNIATDALYDGYNYYNIGDASYNIMSNQPLTITKAGLPFGSFYGYKVLGQFKTDAQAASQTVNGVAAHAGDLIFAHDAKNGKDISPSDRQVIGNPNPKLVYGLNLHLNYGGFDLSALFNGVAGVQLFNGVKAYEQYPFQDGNTTTKVFGDSYLGSNGLTSQPRLGVVGTSGGFTLDPNGNYTTVNSYFVESGAYFKLKNLQVGYTFMEKWMEPAKIKSARVFVMANNVFTITHYSGLDPEVGSGYSLAAQSGVVGSSVGVTTRGLDAVPQYPQVRIFSAGLDVNF